MENALIHGIKNNVCSTCTCPSKALCDWASEDLYTLYLWGQSSVAHAFFMSNLGDKALDERSMKRIKNVLWQMPLIQSADVVRADLPHNIYLGIVKHLMEWIESFSRKHKRMERFDYIWQNLPPYPEFCKPTTGNHQISQW